MYVYYNANNAICNSDYMVIFHLKILYKYTKIVIGR